MMHSSVIDAIGSRNLPTSEKVKCELIYRGASKYRMRAASRAARVGT